MVFSEGMVFVQHACMALSVLHCMHCVCNKASVGFPKSMAKRLFGGRASEALGHDCGIGEGNVYHLSVHGRPPLHHVTPGTLTRSCLGSMLIYVPRRR